MVEICRITLGAIILCQSGVQSRRGKLRTGCRIRRITLVGFAVNDQIIDVSVGRHVWQERESRESDRSDDLHAGYVTC